MTLEKLCDVDRHKKFYEYRHTKPIPSSPASEFWHRAIEYAKNKRLDICPSCNKEIKRHKIVSQGIMQIRCKCGYTTFIREDEIQNIQKNYY